MPKKETRLQQKIKEITGKSFFQLVDENFKPGASRREILAFLLEETKNQLKLKESAIFYWVHSGINAGLIKNFYFRPRVLKNKKNKPIVSKKEKMKIPLKIPKNEEIVETEEESIIAEDTNLVEMNQKIHSETECSEKEEIESKEKVELEAEIIPNNIIPVEDFLEKKESNPRVIRSSIAKRDDEEEEKEDDKDEGYPIELHCHCEECNYDFNKTSKCSNNHLIALRTIQCPQCGSWGNSVVNFQLNGICATKSLFNEGNHKREYFIDENGQKIEDPFFKVT